MNLICFDHNFDPPHINVVSLTPENCPKSHNSSTETLLFVEKVPDMYLLLGLYLLFSKNSCTFWTENILFDYSGATFVPYI